MHTREKVAVLLTALTLLLPVVGIAYADSPSQPKMVGSQWAVYEQVTLPSGSLNFYPAAHATTIPTGVQFSMPDATASSPAYVNYLLDTFTTSLIESNTITATINVVTSAATTAFVGNPDGGNPSYSAVRLFIQANLPNDHSAACVGGSANVNNYWWSNPVSYTFVSGGSVTSFTLTATLSPANWSGICGNFDTLNPTAFDSAIASIKYVGLSFGSGSFFANGMGVDGTTGTATFQLISYTIS
jgi:hypothetical protein